VSGRPPPADRDRPLALQSPPDRNDSWFLNKPTNNQSTAEIILKFRATLPQSQRFSDILAAVWPESSLTRTGPAEIPAALCAKMNQNGSLGTKAAQASCGKKEEKTQRFPRTLTKLA
jgi:hypothetical protein